MEVIGTDAIVRTALGDEHVEEAPGGEGVAFVVVGVGVAVGVAASGGGRVRGRRRR